MKTMIRGIVVLLLALLAKEAHAAITCNITASSGWSVAYVTTNPANTVTQSSFTLTCQRNVAADPTTLNYFVSSDNGSNVTGQQNRAKLTTGNSFILYEDYRDSACTQLWKAAGGNRMSGSITLTGFVATQVTLPYWGCVFASQTGLPSGAYQDTVTMTATNSTGGATLATNVFTVNIYYPAVCNVTQAPADVAFSYTAFRSTAATASSTFGVTCTNTLPYSMALDATSGVVAGLQYLLTLSASNATGTGAQQAFTIDGTMPAGQAGTCAVASCTGTSVRTLTITY